MIRFENKSYKEVVKMMTLTTPLEETVSYKELIAIGEKKGEKRGEKRGEKIGAKIGVQQLLLKMVSLKYKVDNDYLISLIEPLSLRQLEELSIKIFETETFDEMKEWINTIKDV